MENQKPITEKSKESLVDTLGNVSYSLIVGSALDYASGLRGWGIVASRSYATAINTPTGAPYGKWRNFLYRKTKTTDEDSKLRQGAVELLAFNTFQVPLYATVVAVGSLASNLLNGEIKIDLEKVKNGAESLAMISPIIAPTMGWYMNGLRKLFKLKSSGKKARESLEDMTIK